MSLWMCLPVPDACCQRLDASWVSTDQLPCHPVAGDSPLSHGKEQRSLCLLGAPVPFVVAAGEVCSHDVRQALRSHLCRNRATVCILEPHSGIQVGFLEARSEAHLLIPKTQCCQPLRPVATSLPAWCLLEPALWPADTTGVWEACPDICHRLLKHATSFLPSLERWTECRCCW